MKITFTLSSQEEKNVIFFLWVIVVYTWKELLLSFKTVLTGKENPSILLPRLCLV